MKKLEIGAKVLVYRTYDNDSPAQAAFIGTWGFLVKGPYPDSPVRARPPRPCSCWTIAGGNVVEKKFQALGSSHTKTLVNVPASILMRIDDDELDKVVEEKELEHG